MSLIEKLANIIGFYPSYTGAFGDQVTANEKTQRALLSAMGFALDDESLTQSISTLEQEQWTNMLPKAHIAKSEEACHSITISLPKSTSNILTLTIKKESDEEISQSIDIKKLRCINETAVNNTHYCQYSLPLPSLEPGYHKLYITIDDKQGECALIFAPKNCYSPEEASLNKVWGFTAQLYSLRSKNNWGIGDFTDLAHLVESSAKLDASTIGLNPLHPLYQKNPAHRSPYSPSTRCFLNPLYIDVTKVDNFKSCEPAQKKVADSNFIEQLSSTKANDYVDYPAVAKLKFEVIELLFENFTANKTTICSEMAAEYETFKQQQGNDLYQFATFDALYEYFNNADSNVYGWTDWPKSFHEPSGESVKEFQQTNAKRIEYFIFLQWVADKQLNSVSDCANKMPIGLYLDLAVGCDGSGFDVWSDQNLYVAGASIGAPPDGMNPLGQNWGLTPMNPIALQQQGYQPLIKALRSSMQYAGALRIDHILGLMRQYWVAPGLQANEGVYISFPFDDILRIIALESRRNNCIVIGEDLGNVPDGFSETIQNSGLLSFKVMFFERWESGLFKRPENFPEKSVVTIATHDTATLTGWWQGRDLEWRQHLNLYPNEEAGIADRAARDGERQNLISALEDLNVIDMSKAPKQHPAIMNTELSIAVQKFLAHSNSHIQLIPLEDALEIPEQVNIPGTIDQHPNWLQKLPIELEDFWQNNSLISIANTMKTFRPIG